MITFDLPAARFLYRVVGVAIREGHVLLHRALRDDFWSLPGGRCEALETSEETLIREMQEEIGLTVIIERLVWVVENFFTLDGQAYHELGLYYLMTLPAGAPQLDVTTPFAGLETKHVPDVVELIFQWFPLDALPSLRLYPFFLRAGLQALPDHITQVITHDVADDGVSSRIIMRG
ncbi:MAG TPA: NUDIX hydrolase [Ktedonobacterales bacterium]|nr:NUDIX hydrolase [Ktedonobacterales bacterium]